MIPTTNPSVVRRPIRRSVLSAATDLGRSVLVLLVAAAAIVVTSPAPSVEAASTPTFRALDTRSGAQPGYGTTTCVRVAGLNSIPSSAHAVTVNIAAVQPRAQGYITAYPSGTSRPSTSTVNYQAGRNISNNAIVQVGSLSKICLYASAQTHLLVDVTGYFTTGDFRSVAARRARDTRTGAKPRPGSTVCAQVTGNGVPPDAKAVFVNVTSVRPEANGNLTAFPNGVSRPGIPTVKYRANETIANGAVVEVGSLGRVCVHTTKYSHVLIDVTGYFPSSSQYIGLTGSRLLDTRNSTWLTSGSTRCVRVVGRGGVADNATSVFVNLTAVSPSSNGFLTVDPAGAPRSATSSMNYRTGETRSNGGWVRIGRDGDICVYSSKSTHVTIDVVGYLEGDTPYSANCKGIGRQTYLIRTSPPGVPPSFIVYCLRPNSVFSCPAGQMPVMTPARLGYGSIVQNGVTQYASYQVWAPGDCGTSLPDYTWGPIGDQITSACRNKPFQFAVLIVGTRGVYGGVAAFVIGGTCLIYA